MAETRDLQFQRLIHLLKTEITSNGVSKPLKEDLEEAKLKLNDVKEKYLKNKMIINELKNICNKNYGKKKEGKASKEDEKVCLMLQDAIAATEACRYLKLSKTSEDQECNLFGLSEDEMKIKSQRKNERQQIFQQYFISEIEQSLKKQCIDLIRLWDSRSEEESDGLALAKAKNLPDMIEKELRKSNEENEMLQNELTANHKLKLEHKKVVCACFESLEQSLKSDALKANLDNTDVTVKWLATKCDAIQQKIKVLQCQLIKDTYSKESVIALHKIKRILDAALSESKFELTRIRETLQVYESVGPAFESLVKQYVQLTAEIDNKKWALSELKRSRALNNA